MNMQNSDPSAQSPAEIVARPVNSSPRRIANTPLAEPTSPSQPSTCVPQPSFGQPRSIFEEPLPAADHRLATIESSQTQVSVASVAGSLACQSGRHVRKGKIARLPKDVRDLVSRMLQNNVPYSKIVAALDELCILVTQRNISNWRTRGGYKEWCAEQERQLQLSHMQDHLTDYLRKNDAGQLPEVGLQVAATQLSSMLLQPEAVQQLTAHPEKYSTVVDMLCRLSTQIQSLQKDRNETVRKAAIRGTLEHDRRHEQAVIENLRLKFTGKIATSLTDSNDPHRNELPMRDQLPFRDPPPMGPSLSQRMERAMLEAAGIVFPSSQPVRTASPKAAVPDGPSKDAVPSKPPTGQ